MLRWFRDRERKKNANFVTLLIFWLSQRLQSKSMRSVFNFFYFAPFFRSSHNSRALLFTSFLSCCTYIPFVRLSKAYFTLAVSHTQIALSPMIIAIERPKKKQNFDWIYIFFVRVFFCSPLNFCFHFAFNERTTKNKTEKHTKRRKKKIIIIYLCDEKEENDYGDSDIGRRRRRRQWWWKRRRIGRSEKRTQHTIINILVRNIHEYRAV